MDYLDDDPPPELPLPASALSPTCDIQGINWSTFHPTTRATFRDQRIQNYRNYRNTSTPHTELYPSLHRGYTTAQLYDFKFTLMNHPFKCSEYHFQLRNLLWSVTPHCVLYSHGDSIRAWSTLTHTSSQVLQTNRFRPSTIGASPRVAVIGGFNGEYVCRALEGENREERVGVLTTDPMGITNHVEVGEGRDGEVVGVVSSNDAMVRVVEVERGVVREEFGFGWAVNCSSMSPDKRLICVCGDNTDAVVVSADSGDEFVTLTGHIDYSFACAWSPCNRFLATGNQDLTTRIYDLRNPSTALVVLPATLGAIRSLRFSDDGKFLAASEPCDFVHVYDFHGTAGLCDVEGGVVSPLGTGAFESQVIDFFGEVAGISFSKGDGGGTLFVGVSDQRYGSILEFERRRGFGEAFLREVVL
ncbi:hypothetical protein HDU98_010740 [Podochytrium sp. JEL0797]|nr:hypothetical protein HDU98_010740 [Podochytrium sp. JEL0797]